MSAVDRAASLLEASCLHRNGADEALALMSLVKHLPPSVYSAGDAHARRLRLFLADVALPSLALPPSGPLPLRGAGGGAGGGALAHVIVGHHLAAALLASGADDGAVASRLRRGARQLCETIIRTSGLLTSARAARVSGSEDGADADGELRRLRELALTSLRALACAPRCDLGDCPPATLLFAALVAISEMAESLHASGWLLGGSDDAAQRYGDLSSLGTALEVALYACARWRSWRRRARIAADTDGTTARERRRVSDAEYEAEMLAAIAAAASAGGLMRDGRGPACDPLACPLTTVAELTRLSLRDDGGGAPVAVAASGVARSAALLLEQLVVQQAPAAQWRMPAAAGLHLQSALLGALTDASDAADDSRSGGGAAAIAPPHLPELRTLLVLLQRHGFRWLHAAAGSADGSASPIGKEGGDGGAAPAAMTPAGFIALCCSLVAVLLKNAADELEAGLLQESGGGDGGGSVVRKPPASAEASAPEPRGVGGGPALTAQAAAGRPGLAALPPPPSRAARDAALRKGYDSSAARLSLALSLLDELCARVAEHHVRSEEGSGAMPPPPAASGGARATAAASSAPLPPAVLGRALEALRDAYIATALFLQAAAASALRPALEAAAMQMHGGTAPGEAGTLLTAAGDAPAALPSLPALPHALLLAPLLPRCLGAAAAYLRHIDELLVSSADAAVAHAAAEREDGDGGIDPLAGIDGARPRPRVQPVALAPRGASAAASPPAPPLASPSETGELHPAGLVALLGHASPALAALLPALPLFSALAAAAAAGRACAVGAGRGGALLGLSGAAAAAAAADGTAPPPALAALIAVAADSEAATAREAGACGGASKVAETEAARASLRSALDPLRALLPLHAHLLDEAAARTAAAAAAAASAPSGGAVEVEAEAEARDALRAVVLYSVVGSGVLTAAHASALALSRRACLAFMNAAAAAARCAPLPAPARRAAAAAALEELESGARSGALLVAAALHYARALGGAAQRLGPRPAPSESSRADTCGGGSGAERAAEERALRASLAGSSGALRASLLPLIAPCALVCSRGVAACSRVLAAQDDQDGTTGAAIASLRALLEAGAADAAQASADVTAFLAASPGCDAQA